MRRIPGALLLLVLSFSLGWARLGESEYQCVHRYGDVQRKSIRTINGADYPALYFLKSGYIVAVIFAKGAAGVILFVKPDQSALDDSEIGMLLSTESDKTGWTEAPATTERRSWVREDGAVAVYRKGDHSLMVATKDFAAVALHPPPTSGDDATKGL